MACWAPSVVKNNGRYYFFFAANDIQKDGDEKANGGIGVGVGDAAAYASGLLRRERP